MKADKSTPPYLSITAGQLKAIQAALTYAVADHSPAGPNETHFNKLLADLVQALSVPHLTNNEPGSQIEELTTKIPLVSKSTKATFVGEIDTKGLRADYSQFLGQGFEASTTHSAAVHYATFSIRGEKHEITENMGHIGFTVNWTPRGLLDVGSVLRSWMRDDAVRPDQISGWLRAENESRNGHKTGNSINVDQIARWHMLRLLDLCPTPQLATPQAVSRFINSLFGDPNTPSETHTLGDLTRLLSAVHFLPTSAAHTENEPLLEGHFAKLTASKRTSDNDVFVYASVPAPNRLGNIESTYNFTVAQKQITNLRTSIYALRTFKPNPSALSFRPKVIQSSRELTDVPKYAIKLITANNFDDAKFELDALIGVFREVSQGQPLQVLYKPRNDGMGGSRIATLTIALTEAGTQGDHPTPLATHTATVTAHFSPETFSALQNILAKVLQTAQRA